MDVWRKGLKKNLLTITSLSRYVKPAYRAGLANKHGVSLTRASFERLLDRFSLFYTIPVYNRTGGRPRKLQHHHQVLGLLLAFYVGSMKCRSLCLTFGIPTATLSRVLAEAEEALAKALQGWKLRAPKQESKIGHV
ncbi:hypothetical protein L916_16765 [Phytophthora nicotianae]|uniref:DDE Tnp4 domain-containing protein n=1 Tax=Phytophthora nicotianae TaxID=4792 RepID=W2I9T3_PHYNI|nr:hypothetical protein L916_16765 [Phytophthora nicotianae]